MQEAIAHCAHCGFNAPVVGDLEPCTMIGWDRPRSEAGPDLVVRLRCVDRPGCERRQRDYPNERYRRPEFKAIDGV